MQIFAKKRNLTNFVLPFFLAYKDMKEFGSGLQSMLDALLREKVKLKNFVLPFFLAYKDMKEFRSRFQSLLDAFPLLAYQVKYISTLIMNSQFLTTNI